MKNEKLKRVITGIILIILTFPVLFFTDTLILTAYMLIVACIGIYELLKCMKLDALYIVIPAELCAVAAHVILRLRLFGAEDIPSDKLEFIYLCMAVVFIFYMFTLSIFKPDKYNIETNGFGSLMCIYVLSGTMAAVKLCDMDNGKYAFPLIFISAWMTDMFAYFVGVKLGKHKLCPTVSPKKSVEGAIGGVVGNVIGFMIYAFIISNVFRKTTAAYPALIIMAVILSVISQLGDLIFSLVKRRFGRIFPGHGGMLDRFDSITAVSVTIFISYAVLESLRGFV